MTKQNKKTDDKNTEKQSGRDLKSEVGSEKKENLGEQVAQLKEQLLRSQADYQNLVRRGQEDRARFAKLATQDLVEALLQPLDHLEMAAAQLSDPGLDMVVHQFQQVLGQFGVEEIICEGKEFDPIFMEVVESQQSAASSKQDIVQKVISKGYTLNGVVIRHAKVVVN